jgi:hypothetical protein
MMRPNLTSEFLVSRVQQRPAVATATAAAPPVAEAMIARPFIGKTVAEPTRILASAFLLNAIATVQVAQLHLPDETTQSGATYRDRYDTNLLWYIPSLALADDPDPAFAFAATQSGQDKNGNPYNHASLALSLKKSVPADAVAAHQATPALTLREIALDGLSATLTTTYTDDGGNPAHDAIPGTVQAADDGSLRLTFDPLIATAATRAFLNLTNDGAASVRLTASYQIWRKPIARPMLMMFRPAMMPMAMAMRMGPVGPRPFPPRPFPPRPAPPPPAPQSDAYVQAVAQYTLDLPLAKKYTADAYRVKYTIAAGGPARTIVDVNDLRNYDVHQSEYHEFTAVDIDKYASFSRLYLGAVSRRIIAVPAKYGVQRSSMGTAASCEAVVDAGASDGSDCTFEFRFDLAPTVSAIDLIELAQDLAANPESAGCRLVLPDRLDVSACTAVGTAFATSSAWKPGVAPHTFSLVVTVGGGDVHTPAVANANLFIKQLAAEVAPYLTAQVGLKLDDAYPDPVPADVVVNLHMSGGSDEVNTSIDPVAQTIVVTNASPLDLQLTRYGTTNGGPITVFPLNAELAAGTSTAFPLPAAHDVLAVPVDRKLKLESPLTKAALQRYVTFKTQTVQTVQYVLGINATQVDFTGGKLENVDVQITFVDLPDVVVPKLSVSSVHKAASVNVVVPIEHAIASLAATLEVTGARAGAPLAFTLQHDFVDDPIFILKQSDLPAS